MREARITIDDDEFETMGIGGLVSLCDEAGLREFEELACRGNGAIVQVDLEEPLDEDRLDALEAVDRWERVSQGEDDHSYVVSFTAPALPDHLSELSDELVGTCDPEVTDRDATLSLVGSQEVVAAAVREYEAAGVSPDLRKLGAYTGRDRPLDELTDRQLETVRTAYDLGYYEVPRTASTEDVAAELDVDPSTVTEHLQRAERNLLGHHLAASPE